jgi:hypothetical protein
MNRKWIIPVLAAAAAGVLAFGVTRYAARRAAGPGIDRLRDVSFLTRELNLNDAQADKLKRLHAMLGERLSDCCTRHCTARARLGQAVAAETNGSAQADVVLREMCRAYEQSELATLDHIRAVRAVLNAEQMRRFDTMISDCMCKPCSMHGDGVTLDKVTAADPAKKQTTDAEAAPAQGQGQDQSAMKGGKCYK